MSKMRPRASGEVPAPGRPWIQRVFQNTYSYKGRLVKVKGWSVKIQHQGQRRTFSLRARGRTEAASEAEELY